VETFRYSHDRRPNDGGPNTSQKRYKAMTVVVGTKPEGRHFTKNLR
jgi:hypothetical protein